MRPRTVAATLGLVALLVAYHAPPSLAESPVALQYYVTDSAGVLGYQDYSDIQNLIESIQENTTAQVAVFIVNTTSPLSIDQFAVQTFEKSKLGQQGVDNGVLVVIAVNDQRWRIEVGYGLEAVLNDAKVGAIGRAYLSPAFGSGDFGNGTYDTVAALGDEIASSDTSHPAGYPIPGIPLNWWQLVVVGVIFLGVAVLTRGRVFVFAWSLFGRGGGGRSGGGGADGGRQLRVASGDTPSMGQIG